MPKIRRVENIDGRFHMYCPGCKMDHAVYTQNKNGPNWSFNGNVENPTFSPSLLVRYNWGKLQKQVVCHSFIRDGVWQFLSDCTHDLAGQNVPMIEVD